MRPLDPISVLLVAYNEAGTITTEITNWERVLEMIPGSEIVVAEDGSRDGTSEILHQFEVEGRIRHISSQVRRGYRAALQEGFAAATNDYVVFSDTGLKNDVLDFWALYCRRQENSLVVGRKVLRQDPVYRRLLTKTYNFCLRRYFGMPLIFDADSGFRIYGANARTVLSQSDFIFQDLIASEITLRCIASGVDYTEVPIRYVGRSGVSRGLPPRQIPRKVIRVLRSFPNLKKQLATCAP